ncbi:hypothetical protein GRF61_11380 [Azoarcus sp. TTM-91]|uniref:hypothetical protein n=1 Tax=Azoarcus sp. TTM-91 TaxID=2691581 RepID=UPI00145F7BE5|nr:hypothetical protein [Azoarcus sp. TTM-91]NMG35043.1 hypothetical protein [Azoarcus sp. TTM-91]
MLFSRRSRSHTRSLTAGAFELSVRRRYRRIAAITGICVVFFVLLAGGVHYFEKKWAPAIRLAELEQRNSELREEVERLKLEVQMEHATRGELEKQLADLSSEADKLKSELGFYKSQGGLQRR